MALQKGDFILINYTVKVKETNEVFGTTVEEIAKKEKLQLESEIYEPKLAIIGEGWMLKGKILKTMDDSLINMELTKPATIEIPPSQAFGPRNPEQLKRVSLRTLFERNVRDPAIGKIIEYGEKKATIRSIGAGRALLDFNEELAGRTLIYDATIVKKLETTEEKISALIHRRIPVVAPDSFKLTIEPNTLTVEMPDEAFYLEGIQIAKRIIALDVQKYLPEITTLKFVESFNAPPKPAETKANESKSAEDKPATETKS
jgi:peptidylprolyl isomerase